MQTRRRDLFTTIKTEGAILPTDLLQKIVDGSKDIEGITPESYHLDKAEKINEVINRSWNRLVGSWSSFQTSLNKLPSNDPGTSVTRERWLLPLFQELGYGRLPTSKAIELEGKSYPISHTWHHSPIHLVGCNIDLDRRTARVAGAARTSPHSLVQEFLNRSDDYLWGFVSNGNNLRILRDNISLTRQAFVEFDLKAMMEGEVYSDFILLWLLCHQSRVENERPEKCWLEQWSKSALEQGTRALESLREGVVEAIKALGKGFIEHPANRILKAKLKSGDFSTQDYYHQLLRTVYRLLFLFVAEDRELLIDPNADKEAKKRYKQFYSAVRLRRLAEKRKGSRHPDLWQGLRLIFEKLGLDEGCPELGLPALGSYLWSGEATSDINDCEISNYYLLDAVRALAFTVDGKVRRSVDYKNLGSEEMGSIYESLLELHPDVNIEATSFELTTAAGHERKTTGSYYTPSSLINCLLDSALDPVINEAIKKEDPEKALLNLKVCDPASGSGHFLIAATHRLAKRLAFVRTGDEEPSPEATRTALRDVIGRCIYGVDINPMAVELCKVALWMESIEPGKPLSFLDHHIKCGNSLLGTTPALLNKGIPDNAFKPIEGDDKKICSEYRKANKQERESLQESLFDAELQPWESLGDLTTSIINLDNIADDNIEGIHTKSQQYEELTKSTSYMFGRFWADAWCSAFVWKKTKEFPYPITEEVFRKIQKNPHSIPHWMRDEIKRLARQYQLFHWHLEFPEVFAMSGFDCVLGNPPWEKVQPEERQFFIVIRPDIALATGAERKKLIAALKQHDERLWVKWKAYCMGFDRFSHFVRTSCRYTLSAVGNLNTSTLFLDLSTMIASSIGQVGMIIPSGIATNEISSDFFQSFVCNSRIRCLYDFENGQSMFPDVDSRFRFCLIVIGESFRAHQGTDFSFYRKSITELADPTNHFTLDLKDFELLSPNTGTCPTFTSVADAELTKAVYRRIPVFIREKPTEINPWRTRIYAEMYNMTRASHLFHTTEALLGTGARQDGAVFRQGSDVYLPVYEARMLGHYDHRLCSVGINPQNIFRGAVSESTTIDDHALPDYFAAPRFWLSRDDFNNEILHGYNKQWFSGFRMVTAATNERTMIASIFPRTPFVNTISGLFNDLSAESNALLVANLSSFMLDYISRQRISGVSLNFFVAKQLPIIPPDSHLDRAFIVPRVLELIYTAWDLEPFAKDCGWPNPPFYWDEERRFLIRCELDAVFFQLYLGKEEEWQNMGSSELLKAFPIPKDAMGYIMETFPIVKKKDIKQHGTYRTKELILEIYDAMSESIQTGKPYKTILDPPPGPPTNPDGTFAKLPDWPKGAPKPKDWPPHIHEPRRV